MTGGGKAAPNAPVSPEAMTVPDGNSGKEEAIAPKRQR